MKKISRLLGCCLALCLTAAPLLSPGKANAASNKTITVDASTTTGTQPFRPERSKILKVDEPTFMEVSVNYPGGIYHQYLTPNSNLSLKVDQINAQSANFDDVDLVVSGWPSSCSTGDYNCYETVMISVLTTLKQGIAKFKYYEVENESDLHLTQTEFDSRYERAINAVNAVNSLVSNGPSLLIGPNFALGTGSFATNFLSYAQSNSLQMVMYTYHRYGTSANLQSHLDTVEGLLNTYGYSNVPVLLTEYGYTYNEYNMTSNTDAAKYGAHVAAIDNLLADSDLTAAIHFNVMDQYSYRDSEYRTDPVTSSVGSGFQTYSLSSPADMRYILINPEGTNSNGATTNQTGIKEIEVWGPSSRITTVNCTAFPNLVDGSTSTGETINRAVFASFELDLGSVQTVSSVKIYWTNGATQTNQFTAWSSQDEVSYTPILGGVLPDPTANVMKMQARLLDSKVQVTGNSTDSSGHGPIALATEDSNHVNMMISNYQDGGASDFNLTLNVNNLPSGFSGKSVRYEVFQVDATHGNTLYDPAQTAAPLISSGTNASGNQSLSIYLPADSATLVTLSPVLFSDDFEDGNDTGWTKPTGSWSVVADGSKVYKQSNSTGGSAYNGDIAWTDYTVDAWLKTLSLGSGTISLSMRYHDNNNRYFVMINDHTLYIRKNVGGVQSTIASKPMTFDDNTAYRIKASITGSTIQVYVNDQIELTGTDSANSFTSGKIGLNMFNATGEYDNVIVTR